jgi:hypothetical protein
MAPSSIGDSGAFLCIPMKIGVKSEHCRPPFYAQPHDLYFSLTLKS